MRILHVIDSAGIYGAENMLLSLMREQVKDGCEPVLASIGSLQSDEKEIESVAREQALQVETFRMRPGLNIKGIRQVLNFASDRDIDILHTHGYKGSILFSLLGKYRRGMPLVASLHGWTNTKAISKLGLYEWLDRRLLPYKDAVVLVSPSMLMDQRIMEAGIDPDKLYVIENGIDFCETASNTQDGHTIRTVKEFCQHGYIIGAIGRLSKEKGYEYLIAAIKLLRDSGHDVRLVLLGEGGLREQLQAQIKELSLDKYVLLTGYVKNARDYLAFFDVFVISSLTEGFPITLLEAMNARIPVVSTTVGCLPEVLGAPESGLLVMPENPAALAEALAKLKDNNDLAATLAESGYDKARNKYSSKVMADKYLAVYQQAKHSCS